MAARKKQKQKKSADPDFWENLPNKKKAHLLPRVSLCAAVYPLFFIHAWWSAIYGARCASVARRGRIAD